MKRLVLLRHGVTDWNVSGRLMGRAEIPLNEQGQRQAKRIAEFLPMDGVHVVYSSPQLRARETAEPLAEALAVEIVVEAAFDEVWLAPAWQGKTLAELRGDLELERVIADPMYRSESLEPIAAVQIRTTAAVEKLRKRHPDRTVAVFSHGDPLRAIIAHYLGLELAKFRSLACDNGSMTVIEFLARGPRLSLLNFRPGSRF